MRLKETFRLLNILNNLNNDTYIIFHQHMIFMCWFSLSYYLNIGDY